jgi:tetratricopeptide (TPR) repeat protein
MNSFRTVSLFYLLFSVLVLDATAQTAQELYNRARSKAEMQNFKGALNDVNAAIEKDPKFIQAFNYRGYVKDELNDYQGALADYNLAIALKGDYSEAYANRGKAKQKMRDFKGAVEDYTTAITLNPK